MGNTRTTQTPIPFPLTTFFCLYASIQAAALRNFLYILTHQHQSSNRQPCRESPICPSLRSPLTSSPPPPVSVTQSTSIYIHKQHIHSVFAGSLLNKRKPELLEIGTALGLPTDDVRVTDLVKSIQAHLDANEAKLASNPTFKGLFYKKRS